MRVAEQDYVMIQDSKQKKMLVHVKTIEPLFGVVCDDNKRDKELAKHVEFEQADVIANFGTKLHFGMAYGLPIESVKSQIDREPWHAVKFFRKISDAEKSLILKALDRTSKVVLDAKMFQKEVPIIVHVKEAKGPYGGMYQTFKSKENEEPHPDVITLKVKDFGELEYVIYHEQGHGVWNRMMDESIKARWIEMFYQNISLIQDFNEKLKTMRTELIAAKTIREYLGDLEENDVDIFRHVLAHVKKQYNIKPLHINILIAAGNDLLDIWPKKVSAIPQANLLVTDYATTDPEELWCESFAHYFHPQKQLPKTVEKLMEKTIAATRYGSNHKGKGD